MKRKLQAAYIKSSLVASESYSTYVPKALPPIPAINMSEISEWLEKANLAIGELNGIVESLPDQSIVNYMYVRKEAVLSSQIEGTQSTLDDLLRYESDGTAGVPINDVTEVSSYVAALKHGLERIQGGFPLSFRLVREIHKILLTNARGFDKTPGEFRKTQNWIGGTRPGNAHFVPPPPDKVKDCLGELEKYIHAKDKMPILVRAALIHHQFETIHPFLDGNGRAGRLLITLYLYVAGFLRSPFLYLSLFFRKHRDLYYEKLTEPRKTGDWESWLNFFLEGVAETAVDAKITLLKIKKLFAFDDEKLSGLGRASASARTIFTIFKQKPVLNIAEIIRRTRLTKPTAISGVKKLIDLEIVEKISEKKWRQVYAYSSYIALLRF
ncbi:MAG: Fic family protein [Treponema sp.]|jgi:Fic family protein|nr:Fic family protein [Treponema sp.]